MGRWNDNAELNEVIFRNSDIVTFHSYSPVDSLAKHVADLKKHGRPIINTEWLNRGDGSLVDTCLPIFVKENIGCMHWGLVAGKTQTNLNWGHRPGDPEPKTPQHDLYDKDFKPYYPKEIEGFKEAIAKMKK